MRSSTLCRLAILALVLSTCGQLSLDAGCNANGVDDVEEIASGATVDCNLNEIPDECETAPLDLSLFGMELTLPGSPRQPRTADFDLNGFGDFAVGTSLGEGEGSKVLVFLGTGDGTFSQAEFSREDDLSALLVGHFDDDDAPDLVAVSATRVTLLWNDGSGGFGETTEVELPVDSDGAVAADLSGDGRDDLILIHATEPRLDVLINQGAGNFTLEAPVPLSAPARDIEPADYDGDGAIDIAVTYRSTTLLSLFLGSGGTFGESQDIDVLLKGAFNVLAADLDGDSDLDLAVGSLSDIAVTENQGGVFDVPTVYDEGRPNSFAAADVDADGDLDLVVGNTFSSSLLVRHNNESDFSLRSSLPTGLNPRGITTLDVDADGDQEVAALAGEGSNTRLIVIANGNHLRPDSLRFSSSTQGTRGLPHSIAVADFNQDGFIDVATPNGSKSTVSVLLARSDATYESAKTYRFSVAVETILQTITAGDLDGDTYPDIVAGDLRKQVIHVRFNDGNATFHEGTCYPSGNGPRMVLTADMNGDGGEDILSANESNDSVSILFGLGERDFAPRQDVPVGSRPLALVAHDFDADGALDLAVACHNARELWLLHNLGEGTFAPAVVYPVLGRPNFIGGGFFDEDNVFDLAVVHDGLVTIFTGDGSGGFDERGSVDTFQTPFSLATGDIDGDGHFDVVTANPNGAAFGSVSLVRGNGDGTLREPVRYAVGAECRLVAVADIEGDGDTDIISANRSSENITILRNDTPETAPYVEGICTELEFFDLSEPAASPPEAARRLRYYVAATEIPGVPAVFFEQTEGTTSPALFLSEAFPAAFPALTDGGFAALALERTSRRLFTGDLLEFRNTSGRSYGFTVRVSEADATEAPRLEEATTIFTALRDAIAFENLSYYPETESARANAESWAKPSFPILGATTTIVPFRRGDVDASGGINITDGSLLLNHLFIGNAPIPCVKGADADDSNRLDVSDALYILNFLFLGGPPPAEPFEACGSDTSEDALSCESFAACP
jgi:hypothetical protein